MSATLRDQNRVLVTKLLVIVAGMLGFAYAMVPMYRQVCDALGISASRIVEPANTQVDASREVTVDLFASTSGLPWQFEALDRSVSMHPGELVTVRYRVVNTLGRPVTARAVMSTAPAEAAQWISKQQCFCFSEQTLQPGESRVMPVVFRVLPEAPRDLGVIALSYSFMEVPGRS